MGPGNGCIVRNRSRAGEATGRRGPEYRLGRAHAGKVGGTVIYDDAGVDDLAAGFDYTALVIESGNYGTGSGDIIYGSLSNH